MTAATAIVVTACGGGVNSDGGGGAAGEVAASRGVDVDAQIIRLGGLFDLSGPLAQLGVPWRASVDAAIEQVNESGHLGDWTLELVVRDHGFNPSDSVAMYEEIKGDVAMIVPSLGTQPTAPLLPRFANDDMLAFVGGGASSSVTSHSIWGFNSYRNEAARAVDHAVDEAGDAARMAIVYTDDDSGVDALEGFRAATDSLGVEVLAELGVEVDTDDWTPTISRLEEAGATHVLLAMSVGQVAGALATAPNLDYEPQWYGTLPSFLEAVMYDALPEEVWASSFLWVHGLPYWGEDRPGMQEFIDAYDTSSAAANFPGPQFWGLVGYLQVQLAAEILAHAIEADDLTPEGIRTASQSVTDFDAGGLLIDQVDLSGEVASTATRVLRPDAEARTWEVVGEAKSLGH